MLRKGRGGYVLGDSGASRLRTCLVVAFMEFLLLASVGWATRTSTTVPADHIALSDDGSNEIATIRPHNASDRHLALREGQPIPKDVDLLRTSFNGRSVRGLQDLVRKAFESGFNKHKIRVRIRPSEISRHLTRRPAGASPDHQQKLRGSMDNGDHGVIGGGRSRGIISRRLLLTGPSGSRDKRSSSAAPDTWFLGRQQAQEQEQKRRRVIMEAGEQTQQMLMGPPSPPELHNEKQDWNQDYAEPDVHPPSSN